MAPVEAKMRNSAAADPRPAPRPQLKLAEAPVRRDAPEPLNEAPAPRTRRRIPIGVCGEIAGDPRYAALLLGLGLRELSMAPQQIPQVKQRIRSLDMVAATRRARAIMDQADPARIAALLDDFNTALGTA